jgi:hypothetical protein
LASEETDVRAGYALLTEHLDVDAIHAYAAQLLYQQHGGSGFSLTLNEVENMTFPEAERWLESLAMFRGQDADAHKAAMSRTPIR